MNNRWQLAHYPTMPVPEEWKPFIAANMTTQQGQARGSAAHAGTESLMLYANHQPNRGTPIRADFDRYESIGIPYDSVL
jgi:hypothetical protein